jgi:tRNA (cmo5U34)-methyltransferase
VSLVIQSKNFPEHFPKNPREFRFDEEVTTIFENMAHRSIPNYMDMHKINASILEKQYRMIQKPPFVVLDFGASTGMAMKMFCNQLQIPVHEQPLNMRYIAVDNSRSMLDKLAREVPWAETLLVDCEDYTAYPAIDDALEGDRPSAILMLYFLQFIKPTEQTNVMLMANKLLKHRGVLYFGAKEGARDTTAMSGWFNDLYMQLRLDMGYSKKEISAKTKALKESMHVLSKQGIINLLDRSGFGRFYETTRWLQFMSLVGIKD